METKGIAPGHEQTDHTIRAVLFDYGGVLAEEGFREGLMEIGRSHGLSPETFFEQAAEAVYTTGYVTGHAEESAYWGELRDSLGIRGDDADLRRELLSRFVLRPWIMDLVGQLRARDLIVAILSDQTDWLEELDARDDFFKEFHHVFNSFHLGKGKKDPTLFADVAGRLGVHRERMLFIDDNDGHISRAREQGLHTILYEGRDSLIRDLNRMRLLP